MELDSSYIGNGKEEVQEIEKVEATIPDIETSEPIMDIEFHHLEDVIAVGLINGEVLLYKLGETDVVPQLIHKSYCGVDPNSLNNSCRSVRFSLDGKYMLTGSSDCSLSVVDLAQGKMVFSVPQAHDNSISAMMLYGDSMLVTGDDEGCIKLWDLRKQRVCGQWEDNTDYISDFAYNPSDPNVMLASSGDGYLSVLDLKKGNLYAQTQKEEAEDELLSLLIIKDGEKALAGTQSGELLIWDWDYWTGHNDVLKGHPNSVSTMVKIDEDTVCTGSSDGIIRVVTVNPNKFIGVIGDHQDFPVEHMKLSRDKRFLASTSHEDVVKFWNVEWLFEKDDEEEQKEKVQEDVSMDVGEEQMEEAPVNPRKQKKQQKKEKRKNIEQKSAERSNKDNFFSGLM
eukprot:TRINITY_DN6300_c0_g1_i2.p1 TRINITY_DN6300_c0_g1~~TRINITY_DN6300_c0_g1_i2.p1  ORF type:complete len:396 (-),score=111.35 TRINITY_DN6300_c0_g1_i2:82-1269(-)